MQVFVPVAHFRCVLLFVEFQVLFEEVLRAQGMEDFRVGFEGDLVVTVFHPTS